MPRQYEPNRPVLGATGSLHVALSDRPRYYDLKCPYDVITRFGEEGLHFGLTRRWLHRLLLLDQRSLLGDVDSVQEFADILVLNKANLQLIRNNNV